MVDLFGGKTFAFGEDIWTTVNCGVFKGTAEPIL